jgi:hypothetical protein
MKKSLLLLSMLYWVSFSFAQTYNSPESVEFDYANNRWLIANKSAQNILQRTPSGTLSIFAANVGGNPHGLEIVGDTLYACIGGGIKAYLLSNGSLIFSQSLGGSFLNGITHDPQGNLFITDFTAKKIFRFNTATRQFNTYVANTISTPNGIIYDPYDGVNPRILFVNWSSNAAIKSINPADSSVSTLYTTSLSNIDGIAKGNNGNFYISAWSAQGIFAFDSTFTSAPVQVVSGLSNPADIFYNVLSDTLAVPNSGTSGAFGNSVSFHGFVVTGSPQKPITAASQIFPVPFEEELNITISESYERVSIRLINSLGQTVSESQTSGLSKMLKTENLSHLPAGLYFLEITSDDKIIQQQKVLKK